MAIAEFRTISGGIELGTAGFSLPGDNAGFCRSILNKNVNPAPLRLESLTYVLPSDEAKETQNVQQPPTVVNLLMQLRAYYDQSNTFLRSHTALEVQLTSQLRQVLARSNGAVRKQARELEHAIRGSLLKEGELRRSLEQLEREVKKNENNPLNYSRTGSRDRARPAMSARLPVHSVLMEPFRQAMTGVPRAEQGRPVEPAVLTGRQHGRQTPGTSDASSETLRLPALQNLSGPQITAQQESAPGKILEQNRADWQDTSAKRADERTAAREKRNPRRSRTDVHRADDEEQNLQHGQNSVRSQRQREQAGVSAGKVRTAMEYTGAPVGKTAEEERSAGLKRSVQAYERPAETAMVSVQGRVLAAGRPRESAAQQTTNGRSLLVSRPGVWAQTVFAPVREAPWAATFGNLRAGVRLSVGGAGWPELLRTVRSGAFGRPETAVTYRGPEPFIWSTSPYSVGPLLSGQYLGNQRAQVFENYVLQSTLSAPALLQPSVRRERRSAEPSDGFRSLSGLGNAIRLRESREETARVAHAVNQRQVIPGQSGRTENLAVPSVRVQDTANAAGLRAKLPTKSGFFEPFSAQKEQGQGRWLWNPTLKALLAYNVPGRRDFTDGETEHTKLPPLQMAWSASHDTERLAVWAPGSVWQSVAYRRTVQNDSAGSIVARSRSETPALWRGLNTPHAQLPAGQSAPVGIPPRRAAYTGRAMAAAASQNRSLTGPFHLTTLPASPRPTGLQGEGLMHIQSFWPHSGVLSALHNKAEQHNAMAASAVGASLPLLQRQSTQQQLSGQGRLGADHGAVWPLPAAAQVLDQLPKRRQTETQPASAGLKPDFGPLGGRQAARPVTASPGRPFVPAVLQRAIAETALPENRNTLNQNSPLRTIMRNLRIFRQKAAADGVQVSAALRFLRGEPLAYAVPEQMERSILQEPVAEIPANGRVPETGLLWPAHYAQTQGMTMFRSAGLRAEQLVRTLIRRSGPAHNEQNAGGGGLTYFTQPLEPVQPLNTESAVELPASGAEPRIVYRSPAPQPAAVQAVPEQSGEDVLRQQMVSPAAAPLNAAFSYQAPAMPAAANTEPTELTREQEAQIAERVLEEINYNRLTEELLVRVERRLRAERRKFGL